MFSRMKNLTLLVSLAAILTIAPSQSSFAAGKKSSKSATKKKSPKTKSGKSRPAASTVNSESSKPSSSKMQILANAGLSPAPLFGFGGTVGMIKDSGSGFEATLTFASGKSGTVGASVTHIGARYRLGMLKIGYVAAGAGFRMASGKWFVLNSDESAEYEAGSSLNALTLDAALGTQFKFGSILVGADLAGISFPLFKMGVKKTLPTEEDYSESDANAQQGKFDKLAAGMTLTLLKAGVGISF